VQIALLTERIKELTEHLRGFPRTTNPQRPPQARRTAKAPSCLPDQEGQRPLSRRHRTARTPPLALQPRRGAETLAQVQHSRSAGPGKFRNTIRPPSSGGKQPVSQTFETQFAGRTLTIETGKLAMLAGGAVTVRFGDTMVLAPPTVRSATRPRLLPADGRIRRAYVRGRQDPRRLHQSASRARRSQAILACRLTDRPIRPLFRGLQGRYPDRDHVLSTGPGEPDRRPRHLRRVVRADDQRDPVPRPHRGRAHRSHRWRIRGQPHDQRPRALDIDLIVSGTRDAIMMVEAGASIVPERCHGGRDPLRPPRPAALIDIQDEMRAAVGKPKSIGYLRARDELRPEFRQESRRARCEFVVVDVETTGRDPRWRT